MAAQKVLAERDPFSLIEEGHLTIKTKSGEMLPFKMNKAQKHFLKIVKDMWIKGEIIRILVLKGRQLGISTLIEAIIFCFTSQLPNQTSTIIADDLDGSNYIFEMSKLYQEMLADHLKVKLKKSNEKKLEFEDIHSQIIIDTSENKNAGRKFTFRMVHLSEYAFFRRPKELMQGLSQAVPALPGTMIFKETTANGYNEFKEEWNAAERGDTDYVPIFIPWYWNDEYMMKDKGFVIGDPLHGYIAVDEEKIMKIFRKEKIKDPYKRLAWRRWCIKNNCNNDLDVFHAEYPTTPEEAFITTGTNYFPIEQLKEQMCEKI